MLPHDLYSYISPPPRTGRSVKRNFTDWTLFDDWPEQVPVTGAECSRRGSAISSMRCSGLTN